MYMLLMLCIFILHSLLFVLFVFVCVEFYSLVNNEVMSSQSVNSATVPGQA